MAPPPAQLMDLPSELLHDICSEFDMKTLIYLSQMCRGLYHITQFILLKHQVSYLQSWADSGHLVTIPRIEMKDLLGEEDIRFDFVRLDLSNSSPQTTLHSCQRLFSRIDHVSHIELRLSSGPLWKYPSLTASGWSQLSTIINAIVGRPETVLTVTGEEGSGVDWPFAYDLTRKAPGSAKPPTVLPESTTHPIPIVHKFLQRFGGFRTINVPELRPVEVTAIAPTTQIGRPVWQMVRNGIKLSPLYLPRHPSPLLHALHLSGSQLLRLPFFPWTLDTINKAPITSLSFQKTGLRYDDWAYILQSISIPTLSELSLGPSQVAFSDLQAFLLRHPRITFLDLTGGSAIGPLVPHPSTHLLPQLGKLSADLIYLEHFLKPPKAHPELTSVTICSKIGIPGYDYQYRQLDEVLRLIARRKQIKSLVLLLQFQVGLLNWLQESKHPPVKYLSKLDIRIKEELFLSTTAERAISDWLIKFPSLVNFKIRGSIPLGATTDLL